MAVAAIAAHDQLAMAAAVDSVAHDASIDRVDRVVSDRKVAAITIVPGATKKAEAAARVVDHDRTTIVARPASGDLRLDETGIRNNCLSSWPATCCASIACLIGRHKTGHYET